MKSDIDGKWFREMHRKTGITQAEAAAVLGKAPTFLTRIYSGEQEMRIGEARSLSNLMQIPLSQVLIKAGLGKEADLDEVSESARGFSEAAADFEVRQIENVLPESLVEPSNTVQTWRVGTSTLQGLGVMPGDSLKVDPNEKPRTGDIVVAQIYDWRSGSAETVIRGYSHPFLVKTGATVSDIKPETVDNERIVIKGVVTLIWRERPVAS